LRRTKRNNSSIIDTASRGNLICDLLKLLFTHSKTLRYLLRGNGFDLVID